MVRMIRAVVFDWNGTLVDDMAIHLRAFREVLRGMADIKPIDIYLREGKRSIDIISELAKGASRERVREAWHAKEKIYKENSQGIRMLPSGRDLVRKLRGEGLKVGLVTGTRRSSLSHVLTRQEMSMFDHITTANETKKAKPDPEPYLRCIDDLGVKPWEAVAVENAPLGVESAKAAGMFCIAITSTLPEKYLARADSVVATLDEADSVIESMTKT
ncbi:MAG: HAD family phosphatase [Candidatus Aenigmarchaeota archaeon]|nr:HAD family phosphatase [Candidatus Aenigmarchaeota archaeon]